MGIRPDEASQNGDEASQNGDESSQNRDEVVRMGLRPFQIRPIRIGMRPPDVSRRYYKAVHFTLFI